MQRVWDCPGQQQESGHVVPVDPGRKVSACRLWDCAKTRALLGLPAHLTHICTSHLSLGPRITSQASSFHCRCRSVVSQYLFSLDIVPVASVTDQVDTILPSVHLSRLFLGQVQRETIRSQPSVRSH